MTEFEDWASYSLPYDTEFDLDFIGENKIKDC